MPDFARLKQDLLENKSIYLKIKVIPNAPETVIIDFMADGTMKIAVKGRAEKGEANNVLIGFLAKKLDIDKENVLLLSGKTARIKLLKLYGG